MTVISLLKIKKKKKFRSDNSCSKNCTWHGWRNWVDFAVVGCQCCVSLTITNTAIQVLFAFSLSPSSFSRGLSLIHLQALPPSSNMRNPFCSSITNDVDNVNGLCNFDNGLIRMWFWFWCWCWEKCWILPYCRWGL